jgi:hypothetical protein
MKIKSEQHMMMLYLEYLELRFFNLILPRMSLKPMVRVKMLDIEAQPSSSLISDKVILSSLFPPAFYLFVCTKKDTHGALFSRF